MRIAFMHNLRVQNTEDEAEFDSSSTVQAIVDALKRLGHEVDVVEVSGPASHLVARLEALRPDLIFNIAEGRGGRTREAFYPWLSGILGIPYTGSDAYTSTLTLDKFMAKTFLYQHGVTTPHAVFVPTMDGWTPPELSFPVIVKPNFEGSSKGLSSASVVENPEDLQERVAALLRDHPNGAMIEEFVPGRDVSVCFLEKASASTGGLLPPVEYVLPPPEDGQPPSRYAILDYEMKHKRFHEIQKVVPAHLSPETQSDMMKTARTIVRLMRLRDLAKIDFRVRSDGKVYFLESNAIPNLAPGAAMYQAAAAVGLTRIDQVLEAVIKSSAARQGLAGAKSKKKSPLRVGLAFNLKRVVPKSANDDDQDAEYDSPKTIAAVRQALESFGHEVIELEATSEFPVSVASSGVDVVFNLAEGIRGRNREAQVPGILELLDIPYTGSDPATLSISLDKVLAKRIVNQHGVPVAASFVMLTGKEKLPKGLAYPLVVKPVAEGSSKGVSEKSVVRTEDELREIAREIAGKYKQGALVEEFLTGREFTVGLLGDKRPRVLPPMEIVFLNKDKEFPIYTFEHKLDWTDEIRYDAPAVVDPALARQIERVGRDTFNALGCRDVARIDLRMDSRGRVNFIECNPLPGLTPDWSDLCLIAKGANMAYRDLIGEILAPAIRRLRERDRENRPRREALARALANGLATPPDGGNGTFQVSE
jgi:D-alanine-D-alanine ligase